MADQPLSDKNEWEVIVPPLPQEEAEKKFHQWKQEQEANGRGVRLDHVRLDQILMGPGQGCVVRYLVRMSSG